MMKFIELNKNYTLAIKLLMAAVLMLSFALFLMPPLYDVFCDITGLNGKTENKAYTFEASKRISFDSSTETGQLDASNADIESQHSLPPREITVQFITNHNESMPWEFEPVKTSIKAIVGNSYKVSFHAKNTTDQKMTAQAIPSVSPSSAADFLKKIECFCFQEQVLDAGESAELPLSFMMDEDLPKNISKITLSYTLFDITQT